MSHPFVLPIQSQYHGAAIALNNTGISLIERQCYRQAMDVLKDGLSLMKVVLSLMTESSQQQDQQPSDQEARLQREQKAHVSWPIAQEILRKASHGLFHPQPDVGEMSSSSSSPDTINDLVKVVTLDESAATVQQVLLQRQQTQEHESSSLSSEGKKTSPLFLIRIESSALVAVGSTSFAGSSATAPPTSVNSSSHSFDVDSSIILYNFGVAFECMATCSATAAAVTATSIPTTSTPTPSIPASWSSDDWHKRAVAVFELSFQIFHDNFWVGHEQLVAFSPRHAQDLESSLLVDYLPLLIIFLLNLVKQLSPTDSSSSGINSQDDDVSNTTVAARQEALNLNLIQASEIFLYLQSYLAECMTNQGTAPAA